MWTPPLATLGTGSGHSGGPLSAALDRTSAEFEPHPLRLAVTASRLPPSTSSGRSVRGAVKQGEIV